LAQGKCNQQVPKVLVIPHHLECLKEVEWLDFGFSHWRWWVLGLISQQEEYRQDGHGEYSILKEHHILQEVPHVDILVQPDCLDSEAESVAHRSTHGQYPGHEASLTVGEPSIDNHVGACQEDGPSHGLDKVPSKDGPELSIHEAIHSEHGPKELNGKGYSQDETNPEVLKEIHMRCGGWYSEHKVKEDAHVHACRGGQSILLSNGLCGWDHRILDKELHHGTDAYCVEYDPSVPGRLVLLVWGLELLALFYVFICVLHLVDAWKLGRRIYHLSYSLVT
jgi:hypothetical protein